MASAGFSQAKDKTVILISGTHVLGKETLAMKLSSHLGCPWIKAEMAHNSARFAAQAQRRHGCTYTSVFERVWDRKLMQLGFDTLLNENSTETGSRFVAVLTCYAMVQEARHAIRTVFEAKSIGVVLVILDISPEVLSGRTLGAENQALAERIMQSKMADIEEPSVVERDIILIDNSTTVDAMFETLQGQLC